MPKLVLVDAMAIIYRAFYALNKNPRINSKGLNTSAILGFTTTLYDIYKKTQPSHFGVAFDLHGPTIRHEAFVDYKATRQATPEEIIQSIPYIKSMLTALRIPELSAVGYEADDVIGTLAKKAAQQGFSVYMVTPDKDYGQLISEQIFMYRPGRMGKPDEIWGEKEICEQFSIQRPEQIKDLLGLWGDTSDNIPGVPSIGEVKAKKLIQEFDSIENLLANSDKIAVASVRKAIEENKEAALFSKQLATIILDVPIAFDPEALRLKEPDWHACKTIFDELELRSFSKRFFSDFHQSHLLSETQPVRQNKPTSTAKRSSAKEPLLFEIEENVAAESLNQNYILAHTAESRNDILLQIRQHKAFAFHVVNTTDNNAIGIAFAMQPHIGYFVPLVGSFAQKQTILCEFQPCFNDPEIEKTTHQLKTVKHVLRKYGVAIEGRQFDTLLAHYLIDPESRHKIDFLSERYLDYAMLPQNRTEWHEQPNEMDVETALINYAVETADICLQLKSIFHAELEEKQLMPLFTEIEMPLVDVLLSMEEEGVHVDRSYLNELSAQLKVDCEELQGQIFTAAGHPFNISSPKQLGTVLYEELHLAEKVKKTATKQYSTAEDVLLKLKDRHPIVEQILSYRSLSKLISTYIDALPQLIHKETGRIHTNFNQSVAATGRLSSTNPNLQNIPIRTTLGKEIRKAFIPRNDQYVLLAADYSQIELRIIASLSQDQHMMQSFSEGIDIHLATASKIYNLPLCEVSSDMRRHAKSINFGIIYGMSSYGLSEQLSISRKEAQTLIDEYFLQYPQIKSYIDRTIADCRSKGYAETMNGRRRYLPNIQSRNMHLRNFDERNAINMPIQGTCADMIKIAMGSIYREINDHQWRSRMILQVHDELILDVYRPELEEIQAVVRRCMTEAIALQIPVVVDIHTGENWLEAHGS